MALSISQNAEIYCHFAEKRQKVVRALRNALNVWTRVTLSSSRGGLVATCWIEGFTAVAADDVQVAI